MVLLSLGVLLLLAGMSPVFSEAAANNTFRPGEELRSYRRVRAHLRRLNKPAVKTIQALVVSEPSCFLLRGIRVLVFCLLNRVQMVIPSTACSLIFNQHSIIPD